LRKSFQTNKGGHGSAFPKSQEPSSNSRKKKRVSGERPPLQKGKMGKGYSQNRRGCAWRNRKIEKEKRDGNGTKKKKRLRDAQLGRKGKKFLPSLTISKVKEPDITQKRG